MDSRIWIFVVPAKIGKRDGRVSDRVRSPMSASQSTKFAFWSPMSASQSTKFQRTDGSIIYGASLSATPKILFPTTSKRRCLFIFISLHTSIITFCSQIIRVRLFRRQILRSKFTACLNSHWVRIYTLFTDWLFHVVISQCSRDCRCVCPNVKFAPFARGWKITMIRCFVRTSFVYMCAN